MRKRCLVPITSLLALLLTAAPVAAQQAAASLGSDLLRAVEDVEQKIVGLAEAMPAEAWEWRPGEGVRSTREVFQHVAADNFLLPAFAAYPLPDDVPIRTTDYRTVQTYERRQASRDEVLDHLRRSFTFVKDAIRDTSADQLGQTYDVFGSAMTRQALWLLTTTHMHEHLGQLIAYARSNDVVPPWSR